MSLFLQLFVRAFYVVWALAGSNPIFSLFLFGAGFALGHYTKG